MKLIRRRQGRQAIESELPELHLSFWNTPFRLAEICTRGPFHLGEEIQLGKYEGWRKAWAIEGAFTRWGAWDTTEKWEQALKVGAEQEVARLNKIYEEGIAFLQRGPFRLMNQKIIDHAGAEMIEFNARLQDPTRAVVGPAGHARSRELVFAWNNFRIDAGLPPFKEDCWCALCATARFEK